MIRIPNNSLNKLANCLEHMADPWISGTASLTRASTLRAERKGCGQVMTRVCVTFRW